MSTVTTWEFARSAEGRTARIRFRRLGRVIFGCGVLAAVEHLAVTLGLAASVLTGDVPVAEALACVPLLLFMHLLAGALALGGCGLCRFADLEDWWGPWPARGATDG